MKAMREAEYGHLFLLNCQDVPLPQLLPQTASLFVEVPAKMPLRNRCLLPPPPPPSSVGAVSMEHAVIIDDLTDAVEIAEHLQFAAGTDCEGFPVHTSPRKNRFKCFFPSVESLDDDTPRGTYSVRADVEMDENACEMLLGHLETSSSDMSPLRRPRWCRAQPDDIDGVSEPDDDEISTFSAPPPAVCDQAEVTRVTEGTSESGFDDDQDNDQSGTNLTSAVVVAENAAAPLAFNVQPFDNGMHRASGGRWHSAEDNRTLVDAQLRSSLDKIFEDEQFWAEISCEIGTGHLELRSSMDWLQKCSSSVLAQSQRSSQMEKTELLDEVSSQDTNSLDGLFENKQLLEEIPSEISHQDPKLQSCMRWVSSNMIGSGKTEFSL